MIDNYKESKWFAYLDHGMADLVTQSMMLIESEREREKERFHDYSFIVFPAAKAYEGFLKKYLYDVGLLSEETFYGRYFRIGRSLNPNLPDKYKDEDWLYDDVAKLCRSKGQGEVAKRLWQTWKQARNSLFHYFFPDHKNFISFEEAQVRVRSVAAVMEELVECGELG